MLSRNSQQLSLKHISHLANTKMKKINKPKKKYNKLVSLYPLKPEEALAAFIKVNPKKIKKQVKG